MNNPMSLAGVTVVDCSSHVPGPLATQTLLQMGARVIRVERPGGDPSQSLPFYSMINGGKLVVELNLKSDEGRRTMRRLLEASDVLVEGFRPGVLDRLGLGFSAVHQWNADLIYCSLSAYGQNGPRRNHPAHDICFAALVGQLANTLGTGGAQDALGEIGAASTNDHGARPSPVAGALSAMLGVVGILGALRAREQGGTGVALDIAMLDAALLANLVELTVGLEQLRSPRDGVDRDPGYGVYRTADGGAIALGIGVGEDPFWVNLTSALGLPDLASYTTETRVAAAPMIAPILQATFATRTQGAWEAVLESVDVPWAPVRRPTEVLDDMHVQRRGVIGADSLRVPIGIAPATSSRWPDGISHALSELGVEETEVGDARFVPIPHNPPWSS